MSGLRVDAEEGAADGPVHAGHLEAEIRAGGGRGVGPQLAEAAVVRGSRIRPHVGVRDRREVARHRRGGRDAADRMSAPPRRAPPRCPTGAARALAPATGQRDLRPCIRATVGAIPRFRHGLPAGPGEAIACRHPLTGPACPPRHRRRRGLLRHRRRAAARARRPAHHAAVPAAPSRRRSSTAVAPQRALPARGRAAARPPGARARRRPGRPAGAPTSSSSGVPSKAIAEAVGELLHLGVAERAGIVSLAKGLVPPGRHAAHGRARGGLRAARGWPAWAAPRTRARWSRRGAGLVCASHSEVLAHGVAEAFQAGRGGVRGLRRPRGRGAGRGGQERRRGGGGRHPGAGPQRRRHGRGRHLPRGAGAGRCSAAGRPARSWGGRAPATSWPPRSRPARATATAGELLAQGVPAAEIPERRGPGGRGARDRAAARRGRSSAPGSRRRWCRRSPT